MMKMKLEVLLSVMNLNKKELDKMNITSKCTVINQCGQNKKEKYKNYIIYSYDELGAANSRNRGLEHITEDIILLCDDDMIYEKEYKKIVLNEFKNNPRADMIIFNVYSPNRKKRRIKKSKRLHLYNSLHYATCNIAFRRKSLNGIKFNNMFGPNGTYGKAGGDDTLFIVSFLKNKLKIYSSKKNIGTVYHNKSTWFKEYNNSFFFDKGALFTAIFPNLRYALILQYLIRHKNITKNIGFFKAYKLMLEGSKNYIDRCKKMGGDKNE